MAYIYKVGNDIYDASTNQKIPDVATLQKNYSGAKELQPISGSQYNTKALQEANFSNITRAGNTLYGLPKIPNSVDYSKIQSSNGGISPAGNTDFTSPYIASLDPTQKGIESYLEQVNKPLESESKISPITQRANELTQQLYGQPTDYQAELDKFQYNQNINDLMNVNKELASKKAAFDAASIANLSTPGLKDMVGGTNALIAQQKAVELGNVATMAEALQGNITLAETTAKNTVDYKYAPILEDIKNQKWQLEQVENQLTREEKRKADSLLSVLNERQRLIDAEKEKEVNINKLMISAAEQSAPSNILQQMLKSKTPQEAIIIGKDYLKTFNGYTDLGNGNYVNEKTGVINTIDEIRQEQNLEQGIVTTATGDAYDIKSYATDPTHEAKIQSILNGIGKFNTVQDVDNYIQSNYPNSPVTGQMIANSAGKYGVSWEMMTAIMAQDSSMGTAGKAVRTKNPGNVGNTDSGGTKQFNSWQEGVDAVAKNLAWRKTTSFSTATTSNIKNVADAIIAGNAKLTDVPQKDRAAVISEIQNSGKNVAEIEQKQKTAESTKNEAVSIINTLLNSKSIGTATGLSSWTTKIPGTGAYSFGRSFAQLRDLLAMGNIDKLKGAMSDKDIEFLRNSATKLTLGLPKKEFINELNKLKSKLENPTSSISSQNIINSGITSSGIGYTIE